MPLTRDEIRNLQDKHYHVATDYHSWWYLEGYLDVLNKMPFYSDISRQDTWYDAYEQGYRDAEGDLEL